MEKFSKHFQVSELVPEGIHKQWGEKARWFIRPELMKLLDFIREDVGCSITINNWQWGGGHQYSGFRPPQCSIGGKLSQHRFGAGADLKFKGKTVQEVYAYILKNEARFLAAGLRCLEDIRDTPSWLHVDIRDTGNPNKILIVRP